MAPVILTVRHPILQYFAICSDDPMPKSSFSGGCRAILVIEGAAPTAAWQNIVSSWIVGSGCRYMMAWGTLCSSWDDSVDWAAMASKAEVMTTWHDSQPIDEVFWFAKNAIDEDEYPGETLVVHINPENLREEDLRDLWSDA